ncbi:hypothetical protein [Streptomyces sp. NRRL WC-3626]|uniref:hypothetical protein n=1 Tax=Streptomyces sp. NRRL WC-3626 TaxID=1463926 RepID=UPI000AA908AB|nr:hypothetical protein [Streptomyces sp. NRRL WC-3626]
MPAALRGPWRRLARRELPAVEHGLPPGLRFRGHRLFSGVVGRDQLPRSGRVFFRLVGGRSGDFRDWGAVDGWAAGTAGKLRPAPWRRRVPGHNTPGHNAAPPWLTGSIGPATAVAASAACCSGP